jgi:hypothetical protein
MIDIIGKWGSLEQTITQFVRDRIDGYFGSPDFERLKVRYETMQMIKDNKSQAKTNWQWHAKLQFPLVRNQYIVTRAVLKKNFRTAPLITVQPTIGSMDPSTREEADNMQDLFELNFEQTKFRMTTFDEVVDYASAHGCYCVYAQYEQDVLGSGWQTIQDPVTGQYTRVHGSFGDVENVCVYFIHPLRYIHQPGADAVKQPRYQGFIDTWFIDEMIASYEANKSLYIGKNMRAEIAEAKKHARDASHTYSDPSRSRDMARFTTDVYRIWTTLPIEGNEDDKTDYYVEMIGDRIVRIHPNELDYATRPIVAGSLRKRYGDYWWGNSVAEDSISEENALTLIENLRVDNAIKSINDQTVFYPRDYGIDPEDYDITPSGIKFMPYDFKTGDDIKRLMWQFQPQSGGGEGLEHSIREIKEMAQRKAITPDMQRGFNEGGMNNKTATAVTMANNIMDNISADMTEQFSFGLIELAQKMQIIFGQYFSEHLVVQRNPMAPPREFGKYQILKRFNFSIKSSMTQNQIFEYNRLSGIINQLLTLIGSGRPEFANINMVPVIRKFLKTADIGDVDELVPPAQPMAPQIGLPQNAIPFPAQPGQPAQPAVQGQPGLPDIAQGAV